MHFSFFNKRPHKKGVIGSAPKCTKKRLRISEHFLNKNYLKSQNLRYKTKGAGPISKGSKRVQNLFKNIFLPINTLLHVIEKKYVVLDNLNLMIQLFRSNWRNHLIRDFRGQFFTSYISKTRNILKNNIEQKLRKILHSTTCNFFLFFR